MPCRGRTLGFQSPVIECLELFGNSVFHGTVSVLWFLSFFIDIHGTLILEPEIGSRPLVPENTR